MKNKTGIFIALMLIFVLVGGCSRYVKFNAETAQDILEFTRETRDTFQEYLVAWPMYGGIIDGLDENIKKWLPETFWEAKELLDELSSMCQSIDEPPIEQPCDFSDWEPTIVVPPKLFYKMRVLIKTGEVAYRPQFGPMIIFKNAKKNEYVTGYAAGTATVLASSIVFKFLEEVAPFSKDVRWLIRIFPILTL